MKYEEQSEGSFSYLQLNHDILGLDRKDWNQTVCW